MGLPRRALLVIGATFLLAWTAAAQQALTYPDACNSACAPFLRLQSTPPCSISLDNGREDDYECVCKDNIYIVAQESCATCVFTNYPAGLTIDNKTVSVTQYTLATYQYCQSAAAISPYSIISVASVSTASVASASLASVRQASLAAQSTTAAPVSSGRATPSVVATAAKKSNTAAIAGGVAGGVGALLVLAGLLFLYLRRKKNRTDPNEDGQMSENGGAHNGHEKRDPILHEPTPPVQPYVYSNPAMSSSGHFSHAGASEGYSALSSSGMQSPTSPYSPMTSTYNQQSMSQNQRSSLVSSSMTGKALEATRGAGGSTSPGVGGGASEFGQAGGSGGGGGGGEGGVQEGARAVYHEDAGPVVEFPPSYQGQSGQGR